MTKRPSGEWADSAPFTNKAFHPYSMALGQFALAWNDLHVALAALFCTVMGGGFVGPAVAIWHEIKSDRTQRDVLSGSAKAKSLNGFPKNVAQEIEWICKRADTIEDDRNNAVHSPLWCISEKDGKIVIKPVDGLGSARAKKLIGKDILKEFRWGRDASTILRDYAINLDFSFCRGKPLPDRPKLPNRPHPNSK
jgi:hypothetical protein